MTDFDVALRDNPRVVTVAQLLVGRRPVGDPLLVTGGQVQIDETAQYWRSLQSLEIIDRDGTLTPVTAEDPLAPYGNELLIYNGVAGQPLQPVGVFRIAQDDVVYLGDGTTVVVTGYDRSRQISRNVWDVPYTTAPGIRVTDAAMEIASDRLIDVEFDVRTTTSVMTGPLQYKEGDDPWFAMQQVLAPAGIEPLFGPTGRLIIRDIPQLTMSAQPVVSYVSGEGSHITQFSATLADVPGYNRTVVLVQASSLASPLRAVAEDTVPDSPTNVSSKYGQVTHIISSSVATTQAEAQQVADDDLNQNRGGTEQLKISALNDPRREAGDLIGVSVGQITGVQVASSITLDLGLGDMSITTRKLRVPA